MTFEQETDMIALSILASKEYFTHEELVQAYIQIGLPEAGSIFTKFFSHHFFEIEDDPSVGTPERPATSGLIYALRRYSISAIGKTHWEYLKGTRDNEILMLKQAQSFIDTNKSIQKLNDVIIPNNLIEQNKIGNRTLLAITVTAVFSLLTFITSITLRDTETPKALQNISNSLDSLRRDNRKLDSIFNKKSLP